MATVTKKEILKALNAEFSTSALKKKKIDAYEFVLGIDDVADVLDQKLYNPVIRKVAQRLGIKASSMSYEDVEEVVMDEIDKVKAEIKV